MLRLHHADRLSTRLVTEPETAKALERFVLPYGTLANAGSSGSPEQVFTTYTRSDVTGLDYAINRDYDARLGRFLEPDPLGTGAFTIGDPATLNAGAYVRGDPTNLLDPYGLRWTLIYRGTGCVTMEGKTSCTRFYDSVWTPDPGDPRPERGRTDGRGGGSGLRRRLREALGCANPDVFAWFSTEWASTAHTKLGTKGKRATQALPGGPELVAESVHLFGANLTEGPYTAVIAAAGVEVSVAGKAGKNLGYGAIFGGEEHIFPLGSSQVIREPIILVEGGVGPVVGGAYQTHETLADTGMYFGIKAGPFALGIGGNLEADLSNLMRRAAIVALVRAFTGGTPKCD